MVNYMVRVNKKIILLFLILIFVWINSGSVIQAVYSSELQKVICVIGACLLLEELHRFRTIVLPKSMLGVFLLVLAAASVICMLLWGEYSQILLYFSNFVVFYIAYRITIYVDRESFINAFINSITIIALISIVGWFFTDILIKSGLGIHLKKYMDYQTFLAFNIIKTAPNRNCGAFWEPGMFQGFLNFALLLLLTRNNLRKIDYGRIAIIITAIITTYSTTGYFVLLCIIVLYIYRRIYNRLNSLANILLVLFLVFMFVFGGGNYLMGKLTPVLPKDILWKIETQNISYTTRVYSVVYDVLLSIKNPFGVGRLQAENALSQMALQYGYDINARTSAISTAFLNFGFGFGLYYLLLWVVGCFRFSKSDFGTFSLVLISMLMILNSEPMLFHVFFTCVLFYWIDDEKLKKERGNRYGCSMVV